MKKCRTIDLSGEWEFMLSAQAPSAETIDRDDYGDRITLPSTVSQAGKSPLTGERSTGYLTDPRAFQGYALYRREISFTPDPSRDLFLILEKTRVSTLYVNGRKIGTQDSLCTPHRYDITDYVSGDRLRITLVIDNVSCPVPGGHMTSPDTQTNWLGILGGINLLEVPKERAEQVRIFPDITQKNIRVTGRLLGCWELAAVFSVNSRRLSDTGDPGAILSAPICSPTEVVLCGDTERVSGTPENIPSLRERASSQKGDAGTCFSFVIPLDDVSLWSEHSPVCCELLLEYGGVKERIPFGLRQFSARGTSLYCNDTRIFLRGKHDGMVFPLTGAAPTDLNSWLKVMGTAKEYGINHYRFHTCCPPEAAFEAADLLGIYLAPELPFWGTVEEEITPAQEYLIREGFRILDQFGSHPSFFGFSLGNELWGSQKVLDQILADYKAYDDRHLYTQGSNNFQFVPAVLEHEDYFVGVRFSKERLFRGSYAMCDAPLGHIQTQAPNTDYDYDEMIRPGSSSKNKLNTQSNTLENAGGDTLSTALQKFERDTLPTAFQTSGGDALPLAGKQDPGNPSVSLPEEHMERGEKKEASIEGTSKKETSIKGTSGEGPQKPGQTMEIQYGTGVKTVTLTESRELVPQVPVISHEIGQYFLYPDYREIKKYTGVLKPYNLEIFQDRLEKAGLGRLAEDYFFASGKFAADCYKMELETALRSKELAGFQLLDLQDFPGQGTALVGILNAFMENKGILSPENWREFCSSRVLLGCLPGFVYPAGNPLPVSVKYYTYIGRPEKTPRVRLSLLRGKTSCEPQEILLSTVVIDGQETLGETLQDGVYDLGRIYLSLPETEVPCRLTLRLELKDRPEIRNHYFIWVYPQTETPLPELSSRTPEVSLQTAGDTAEITGAPVCVCREWHTARESLSAGKRVLFLPRIPAPQNPPEKDAPERFVPGTYCTDFWNYPMFRSISESVGRPWPVGTLGLLIDPRHPALKDFPTEIYSTPQWYDIVTDAPSMVLDGTGLSPVIRTIDNCERNHNMGILWEAKVLEGNLLVCTSPLDLRQESLPCRQLLQSLLRYLGSSDFAPKAAAEVSWLDEVFGEDA